MTITIIGLTLLVIVLTAAFIIVIKNIIKIINIFWNRF